LPAKDKNPDKISIPYVKTGKSLIYKLNLSLKTKGLSGL
jgi:hypothetical protein